MPNLDGEELAVYELSVRDGGRLRSTVRWELFLFPGRGRELAVVPASRLADYIRRGCAQAPGGWSGRRRSAKTAK
jgi:hypothetical protein